MVAHSVPLLVAWAKPASSTGSAGDRFAGQAVLPMQGLNAACQLVANRAQLLVALAQAAGSPGDWLTGWQRLHCLLGTGKCTTHAVTHCNIPDGGRQSSIAGGPCKAQQLSQLGPATAPIAADPQDGVGVDEGL